MKKWVWIIIILIMVVLAVAVFFILTKSGPPAVGNLPSAGGGEISPPLIPE